MKEVTPGRQRFFMCELDGRSRRETRMRLVLRCQEWKDQVPGCGASSG
jgi:hypothetical protein